MPGGLLRTEQKPNVLRRGCFSPPTLQLARKDNHPRTGERTRDRLRDELVPMFLLFAIYRATRGKSFLYKGSEGKLLGSDDLKGPPSSSLPALQKCLVLYPGARQSQEPIVLVLFLISYRQIIPLRFGDSEEHAPTIWLQVQMSAILPTHTLLSW